MTAAKQAQKPLDHYPIMLKIAQDMGCQLQPAPANPTVLKGLCPFHDAETVANARTLHLDTRNAKFWCQVCPATGNPIAFAAMCWGVSVRDAHLLLTKGGEVGANRPRYPDEFYTTESNAEIPAPQNTAVLTRAARYYGENLYRSYSALYLLARLGIRPEKATKAGLGYATGVGLREHLISRGVDEIEIEHSPLFHQLTSAETLAERITLTDLDFTGAALWITSISPEDPSSNYEWPVRRPGTFGIPGRKSYLVNLYSISSRTPQAVLTDDVRLYIVLASSGIPVALSTQKSRAGQKIEDHCQRMTEALKRRGVQEVVIALHGRRQPDLVKEALNGTRCIIQDRDAMMAVLDPRNRDLEKFTELASQEAPREAEYAVPGPVITTTVEENTP